MTGEYRRARPGHPLWHGGGWILEAQCSRCGETFNPADEHDLIHLQTEAEEPCGGPGEIVGEWRNTAGPAPADRCPTCGVPFDEPPASDDCPVAEDHAVEERAGPWKSGYGEYPFADEIYDLTHESEPDPGDPYDDY